MIKKKEREEERKKERKKEKTLHIKTKQNNSTINTRKSK